MISRLAIRTKLALVMTVLLAVMSIAIYLYFPNKLQRQAIAGVTDQARAIADVTAFSLGGPLAEGKRIAVVEALAGLRRNEDLVYFIVRDSAGNPVTSFNAQVAASANVPAPPARHAVEIGRVGTPGETSGAISADGKLYQTTTVVRNRGREVGSLVLAFSLDRALAAAERTRATIALLTVFTFGIGVALIFALSSFITAPLKRMVRVTERIASGAVAARASVESADEVGQLAGSFNAMLDQLDGARCEMEELNRGLERRVDERARALVESEERYRLLFDRNLAGVYIADMNGRVIACNEACARLFGYASKEEFLASDGCIVYADSLRRGSMMTRLRVQNTVSNEEAELRGRDGESVWVLENARLVPGADGQATVEGILLDVTDRKRSERDVAYKAYHDLLTGLPNRTLFVDRLHVAIAHAQRAGRMVAVIFFDLDDLKAVNDSLGHAMGDTILKMVARRMALTVRDADTVARIGGDEFLILLTDVTDEETAEGIAENHMETLRNPFLIDEDELHVTSSVGVAMYPADGADAETLIRSADGAMYRAKAAGGNRIVCCGGLSPTIGRSEIEQEIREALDRDEFVLLFQPQVSIHDRRLIGVEALVRWQHPQRGFVSPAGFIPAAEQSGLIVPLGERVLRKACAQAASWRQKGFIPPRLSVNVSPRQLYQRNFVGMVEQVLSDTEFDGAFLELELTESMTMQRSDRSIRMLKRLRDRGVSIAVDDFGTGQSSLSYLKDFPVDTVKIDKSFVTDITEQASDQGIVRAVLLLAKQLALRTIAEGVETEAQWAFLRDNGCGEVQGYLVSKPITAQELEERFLERAAPRSITTPHSTRVDEQRASRLGDPA